MGITLKYHDSLPPIVRPKRFSKYELVLKQFLLSRKPVASTKAPSEKQASTMASSFRRDIKKNGWPVRVVKRGFEIYLVNLKMEVGQDVGTAHQSP